MEIEMRLRKDVANMILEVADEQQELTRNVFQGRADVEAHDIIRLVRYAKETE
jgi:hypothetical protein